MPSSIIITLCEVAANGQQRPPLLLVLDTLGDALHTTPGPDVDEVPDEHPRRLVALEMGDQALVELDRVEGHVREEREVGIMGAEVVERQLEAVGTEAVDDVTELLLAQHVGLFGDLQREY